MAKNYYMACLDLEGRHCLVVGGGSVGLEKASGLIACGARVTVALPNGFDVDTDRSTVVRQRYTRWWRSSTACMSRAPGGWTRVTPVGSDHVVVRAGLRPGVGPDCAAAVAAK